MSFDKRQILGPGEGVTYYLERLHPPTAVYLKNMSASAIRFKMATGDRPDRFADDTGAVALTIGTSMTLTNGSIAVTGVGTTFDTELVAGDVVCLDDGKVLGLVASVESATALTLETPWTGATVVATSVSKVTSVFRSLAVGEEQHFMLPLAPDGSTPPNRHYFFFYGQGGQLQVGLVSPGNDRITLVRSTLTESFIAP